MSHHHSHEGLGIKSGSVLRSKSQKKSGQGSSREQMMVGGEAGSGLRYQNQNQPSAECSALDIALQIALGNEQLLWLA